MPATPDLKGEAVCKQFGAVLAWYIILQFVANFCSERLEKRNAARAAPRKTRNDKLEIKNKYVFAKYF